MMMKVIGYTFIVFGIMFGIYFTSQLFEDFWLSLLLIVIFSYGLYLIGQRLRLTNENFKKSFVKLTGAFIVGVVLAPGFLFYIQNQSDVLEQVYNAEKEFFFFNSGTGSNATIVFFVFFILIMLLGYKVTHGWKTGGHFLTVGIVVLFVFFFGYQYVTFDSYSGIHKERGYVSKEWNETEKRLSFESIKEFRIEPFVSYGKLSNPADETRFLWHLIIVPVDGKEFIYNTQSVDGSWLAKYEALQQKAAEENIHFSVMPMNSETYKWYQIDLDLSGKDSQAYNEFFGIQ